MGRVVGRSVQGVALVSAGVGAVTRESPSAPRPRLQRQSETKIKSQVGDQRPRDKRPRPDTPPLCVFGFLP